MRTQELRVTAWVGFAAALVLLAACPTGAQAGDMKFKAVLLWGTNDPKPPEGKDYKPVQAEICDKLKELPLKWSNWFEVRERDFAVSKGPATKVNISDKCELDVKGLGDSSIEVVHIGKGKKVLRRTQSLSLGEMLILGGNSPGSTAWLIVIKRLE